MADSPASAVNAALTYIGHTQYIDVLTEPSAEAAVANQVWDATLREILRAVPWPFAKQRVRPAALIATALDLGQVPGGWAYAYGYPINCVKVRAVWPNMRRPREDQRVPFEVERDSTLQARIILTDQANAEIEFTAFVDDMSQWPADAVDALSWRLAIKFAAGLRKDSKVMKDAMVGYNDAIATAIVGSKTESPGDPQPDPAWIAGRG